LLHCTASQHPHRAQRPPTTARPGPHQARARPPSLDPRPSPRLVSQQLRHRHGLVRLLHQVGIPQPDLVDSPDCLEGPSPSSTLPTSPWRRPNATNLPVSEVERIERTDSSLARSQSSAGGASTTSNLESTITRLLVATKQLLEGAPLVPARPRVHAYLADVEVTLQDSPNGPAARSTRRKSRRSTSSWATTSTSPSPPLLARASR